jgi:hypothetical protein
MEVLIKIQTLKPKRWEEEEEKKETEINGNKRKESNLRFWDLSFKLFGKHGVQHIADLGDVPSDDAEGKVHHRKPSEKGEPFPEERKPNHKVRTFVCPSLG